MRKIFLGLLFALLPALALAAAPTCVVGTGGVAPSATLSFTTPTANTDGTAIATPLTYNLYQGTSSGGETKVASGITGSPVTINTGLLDGTSYYFYIVVVDAHGTSSANSNEVCKTFPNGIPNTVVITIT